MFDCKRNATAFTNLNQTFKDCTVNLSKEFSGVGFGFGDHDEAVVIEDVALQVLRRASLHWTILLPAGLRALKMKVKLLL